MNGIAVEALIDTNCPSSIVALDCVLSVLARKLHAGQYPADLKEEIMRFTAPVFNLKIYGEHQPDVLAQVAKWS